MVQGLEQLLNSVNLSQFLGVATQWCNDNGAETLVDIAIDEECLNMFLDALNLKLIPKKKLLNALRLCAPQEERDGTFRLLDPNGNIRLLVRLPQSGKTTIMLNNITEFMNKYTKPLIIVVCDNSLLLTTQTVTRGRNVTCINVGKITSNASGYCEWKDVDSVDRPDKSVRKKTIDQRILDGEVNTIVLCSNKTRWNDIAELIQRYKTTFNIHLWIDEADKTVGGIDMMDSGSRRRIKQLNEWKTQISMINLITATPFTPKRKWNSFNWIGHHLGGTVELVEVDEIVGQGYHHLSDSQFVEQAELSDEPAEYALKYLTENPTKPGDLFLIPGTTRQSTHFDVRDMCIQSGHFDYVIVLNGKVKSVESESIIFDKSNAKFRHSLKEKEVSEWLSEWYTEYNCKYKRVAITGNLCISRGITISSNTCQITHMIFSGGGNLRENDQLMSRVCGYCYTADNKPTVVCSRDVWEDVSKYQEVVVELTKLAMSANQEDRVLDEEKMNEIIQNIDRNKRNCKKLYEVTCEFVPCDENTFNIEGHRNLFLNAKKRMSPGDTYIPGNFRGVWKKFDYNEIVSQKYSGMATTDSRLTICYMNDILGVAHRKKTGQTNK